MAPPGSGRASPTCPAGHCLRPTHQVNASGHATRIHPMAGPTIARRARMLMTGCSTRRAAGSSPPHRTPADRPLRAAEHGSHGGGRVGSRWLEVLIAMGLTEKTRSTTRSRIVCIGFVTSMNLESRVARKHPLLTDVFGATEFGRTRGRLGLSGTTGVGPSPRNVRFDFPMNSTCCFMLGPTPNTANRVS